MNLRRAIGQSIIGRAELVRGFARRIADQEAQEQSLMLQLIDGAPQELRRWLMDVKVLVKLFGTGRSEDYAFFGHYGFADQKDIQEKFSKLSEAWEGVVSVDTALHEPETIKVTMTAIM